MRNNIGYIDKIIRMLIVLVIACLVFAKLIVGLLAIVLYLTALILALTCFKGSCPVYRVLGINTKKKLNDKAMIHQQNQASRKNRKQKSKYLFSVSEKILIEKKQVLQNSQ